MITNTQIKKIKTLQRVCGLDDDTYRDILRNKAGVSSAKELRSKRQIDAVIMYLSNLSEKVDRKANRRAADWKWEDTEEGRQLIEKSRKIAQRPGRPSIQQFQYIFGLWWSLRHEWKKDDTKQIEPTLNHFLNNARAGKDIKVASWQWLTCDMAHHLINVLKGRVAASR